MSGFQVGVSALAGPAQRFKQIGTDLAVAASGAATAAGNGSAAAGSPIVAGAVDVFKAGVQTALSTLGDDANLLGDKVQKAGVTYQAVDQTAMPTGTGTGTGTGNGNGNGTGTGTGNGTGNGNGNDDSGGGGPPAKPPPPQEVRVATGESLWSIAAKRLGPGASNAEIVAESNRWFEANRDRLGPDRELADGMKLTAPGRARTSG